MFHIKIKTLEINGKIVLYPEIGLKSRNFGTEKCNISNKKIPGWAQQNNADDQRKSELKDRSITITQSEQQRKF